MASVEIPVYRAASRDYEYNEGGHKWAFAPIVGGVHRRLGGLVGGSWDDATEPLAIILAPAGSHVAECDGGGMALFLPGSNSGLSPWDAYLVAKAGADGFSLKR